MAFLNYHHLRYFRAVANEGNLTRAAAHLRISQSALSIQLRKLEESLGHELFLRENKRLKLTESGRLVLDYAESIFRSGEEMMTVLERHSPTRQRILSVGAVATMSRNFQIELLKPFLNRPDLQLVIRSGSLRELLVQLEAHTIDVILSNLPVKREANTGWHCHLLAEQPVSLVSRPSKSRRKFKFPQDLQDASVILPSLESSVRAGFDLIMEQAGVRPIIAAEVDDMAMLRLLARESNALTLVPPVVVQDELRDGILVERHRIARIKKSFYAITPSRRFPNELVRQLVERRG
ncbi:MAG: LysR family transcriptional regulator [Verrucomicrobiales bacterium]|nr:LysR family transcriptional regulator [Verrucomicrobiales bacterium]